MTAPLPDPRAIRIAENESHFRSINERLEGDLEQYASPGEELEFVCECGRDACRDRLALSVERYEAVRADARWFAVVPGHQIPDVEDVVSDHGSHLVVQKHAPTTPIAESLDSRHQS
ncbi:MAG: hypothetical protein M3P50_01275 [Actinomycetota bacterium]|nr:hypothetical protein [Actinomycetota bacterium]